MYTIRALLCPAFLPGSAYNGFTPAWIRLVCTADRARGVVPWTRISGSLCAHGHRSIPGPINIHACKRVRRNRRPWFPFLRPNRWYGFHPVHRRDIEGVVICFQGFLFPLFLPARHYHAIMFESFETRQNRGRDSRNCRLVIFGLMGIVEFDPSRKRRCSTTQILQLLDKYNYIYISYVRSRSMKRIEIISDSRKFDPLIRDSATLSSVRYIVCRLPKMASAS